MRSLVVVLFAILFACALIGFYIGSVTAPPKRSTLNAYSERLQLRRELGLTRAFPL